MQPEAMVATLKSLKLFGMAQAIEELAAQSSPAYLNAQSILDSLLKAETAEREVRSVNYQMKIARFPAYRDLSGFDFAQSVVNEALVRHLHRGEFIDSAQRGADWWSGYRQDASDHRHQCAGDHACASTGSFLLDG